MTAGPEKRLREFERLSLIEKAAFLGGSAFKMLASGIDYALNRTADLIVDIEKSFKEGMDANIEDAKILEEKERPSKKKKTS